MHATAGDARVEVGKDLWQPGRYRAELTAALSYDSGEIDLALQQLGYEIVDSCQWGRSYRHRDNHRREVELDELDDGYGAVRLVLREGDLSVGEANRARGRLRDLFAGLYPRDRFLGEAPSGWKTLPGESGRGRTGPPWCWGGGRRNVDDRTVRSAYSYGGDARWMELGSSSYGNGRMGLPGLFSESL